MLSKRSTQGLAAGALGALIASGGFAATVLPAGAADAPSCADAINAYNASRSELAKARTADANAVDARTAAKTEAQNEYTTAVNNAPADDPATPADEHAAALESAKATRDAKLAAADKAYADGGTQTRLDAARAAETQRSKEADAACQGPAGAPGANGVDAHIVLAPGVCARAVVAPEPPQRLVRVVVLIPCPATVPTPPVVPPTPGQTVVTIPATAQPPVPVQASLPVTH